MSFKAIFKQKPEIIQSAHARVNLIGEHTDYTGGFVLPTLLQFKTTIEMNENNLKKYYDLPRVQGIVDYMYKEDWTNKLDSFYTYTDELDKSRNQNLYEIVPELER